MNFHVHVQKQFTEVQRALQPELYVLLSSLKVVLITIGITQLDEGAMPCQREKERDVYVPHSAWPAASHCTRVSVYGLLGSRKMYFLVAQTK